MADHWSTNGSPWTGVATNGVVKVQETHLRPRNQVLNTLNYNKSQFKGSDDEMDTDCDERFASDSQTEPDDKMEVDEPNKSTTVTATCEDMKDSLENKDSKQSLVPETTVKPAEEEGEPTPTVRLCTEHQHHRIHRKFLVMSKHHIAKLLAHAEWVCDFIRERGIGERLATLKNIDLKRVLEGTLAERAFVRKSVLPIMAIEIADRHFLPKRKLEHRVCKKQLRSQLEVCKREQETKHKGLMNEYQRWNGGRWMREWKEAFAGDLACIDYYHARVKAGLDVRCQIPNLVRFLSGERLWAL